MIKQHTGETATTWINIDRITEPRLEELHRELPILDQRDLRDCLPPQQRPKFVARDGYHFLVLLLPQYLRDECAIVTEEIDIFLTDRAVATAHSGAIPVFAELEQVTERPADARAFFLDIIERLLDYCSPILVHLQNDIEAQERSIGGRLREAQLVTASQLWRNVIAFRRAFVPSAHAIKRLRHALDNDAPRDVCKQLECVLDKTDEIFVLLEDLTSAISDVHETQRSLTALQTNRIMTTLTVIAVLTFPLTLIAALFGMNTVATPLVGQPQDFWIIVGGMTVVAIIMLVYFKIKRWF